MEKKVRTRFAPSPTGYMHIGNLRTALYEYLFAKKNKGDFILRIEDTDTERFVEGAVDVIYRTLQDVGMDHDEGPDKDKGYGPYVQSERMQSGIYKKYAEKLVELGGAYPCFCSQERIASLKNENGITRYDKHCLSLSKEEVKARIAAGEPYVIRQNVPTEGKGTYQDLVFGEISVDYKDIEDGILLKSDGMPTYNFANVIDDHLMGITHVIRGIEYLSSTPKYNLIYDTFGWDRPVYIHVSPVMKDEQHKLSKRNGDASYQDLIAKGYCKEAVLNYIALLGWAPKDGVEKMTLAEMIEKFDVNGISKSPSIFDEAKLRWLSGEYYKEMPVEKFTALAEPYFAKSKVYGKYDLAKLVALVKTRVDVLSEIPEKVNFLEEYGEIDPALYTHKKMKSDVSIAKKVLPAARAVLAQTDDYSNAALYEALKNLAVSMGMKNSQVLWGVRVALTGKESTPGGASEMAELLGKERTLARLDHAIALLESAQ